MGEKNKKILGEKKMRNYRGVTRRCICCIVGVLTSPPGDGYRAHPYDSQRRLP